MKNVIIIILKEIGIAIAILIILSAVTVIAFKDQLPYDEKVPKGEEYATVDRKAYSVSSTDRISEIDQITVTHETNQGQIISAENEIRIQTGKYTPFGTIDNITDLPSEKVGVTVSTQKGNGNADTSDNDDSGNSANGGNSSNNDSGLGLPDSASENMINKIEREQSESSESAASRRMGNTN